MTRNINKLNKIKRAMDELTNPQSPYGLAFEFADWIICNWREIQGEICTYSNFINAKTGEIKLHNKPEVYGDKLKEYLVELWGSQLDTLVEGSEIFVDGEQIHFFSELIEVCTFEQMNADECAIVEELVLSYCECGTALHKYHMNQAVESGIGDTSMFANWKLDDFNRFLNGYAD